MLRRMFTDHNRPFYKSAVTIHIDKPPVDESVRFVVDRFASAGKAIARETAERLVAKEENIPFAEKRPQSDVARPPRPCASRGIQHCTSCKCGAPLPHRHPFDSLNLSSLLNP